MSTEKPKLLHSELTQEVLGAFFTVYNALGYGFLEQVYANALSLELRLRGLRVEREVPVEVQYLGQPVGHYRLDFLIDDRVIVEVKASRALSEEDNQQRFNYLRSSKLHVGLLLHFGPKPGFKRYALGGPRRPGGSSPFPRHPRHPRENALRRRRFRRAAPRQSAQRCARRRAARR